ncbi:MAG: hypothetical protein IJL69_03815 [Oscillospiraceae bacterium]|jgi:hypothetical protein|nr:hypothetical protein [Oscillospiraceae bacterium]
MDKMQKYETSILYRQTGQKARKKSAVGLAPEKKTRYNPVIRSKLQTGGDLE